MYWNVQIAKKSFETLRGRNLQLAKSKKCKRGSENERPADTKPTSTGTGNNLRIHPDYPWLQKRTQQE